MAKNKIHPHIKHFLKSSLLTQITNLSFSNKKTSKTIDGIVTMVQDEYLKIDRKKFSSEEDYLKEIDKISENTINLISSIIRHTTEGLKVIPAELINKKE